MNMNAQMYIIMDTNHRPPSNAINQHRHRKVLVAVILRLIQFQAPVGYYTHLHWLAGPLKIYRPWFCNLSSPTDWLQKSIAVPDNMWLFQQVVNTVQLFLYCTIGISTNLLQVKSATSRSSCKHRRNSQLVSNVCDTTRISYRYLARYLAISSDAYTIDGWERARVLVDWTTTN